MTTTTKAAIGSTNSDATQSDAQKLCQIYRAGKAGQKRISSLLRELNKSLAKNEVAKAEDLSIELADALQLRIDIAMELHQLPNGTTAKGGATKADVIGAVFAPTSKSEHDKRCQASFGKV